MTTLEQIKQRQEYLNSRLLSLLENQEKLITDLLGTQPVDEVNKLEEYLEGLIEQLSFSQEGTERLIHKVYYNFNKLQEAVYAPTKVQG